MQFGTRNLLRSLRSLAQFFIQLEVNVKSKDQGNTENGYVEMYNCSLEFCNWK